MSRETDLAWLAGFIDGEGHIGIFKGRNRSGTPLYRPALKIVNTNLASIRRCREIIGIGRIHPIKSRQAHYRQAYAYWLYNPHSATLLRSLLPYLGVRPEQARLALNASALILTNYRGRLPNHNTEELEWIRVAISALNHGEDEPALMPHEEDQPSLHFEQSPES